MNEFTEIAKKLHVGDLLFEELKKGLLDDTTNKEVIEVIKSYGVEEDMAIIMFFEISQILGHEEDSNNECN